MNEYSCGSSVPATSKSVGEFSVMNTVS